MGVYVTADFASAQMETYPMRLAPSALAAACIVLFAAPALAQTAPAAQPAHPAHPTAPLPEGHPPVSDAPAAHPQGTMPSRTTPQ
jgi:hypothetical protein